MKAYITPQFGYCPLVGMSYSRSLNHKINSLHERALRISVYVGPKIWDLVPNEIKEPESLNGLKFKIKRWVPEGCPCRICKIYLGQVGFIIT